MSGAQHASVEAPGGIEGTSRASVHARVFSETRRAPDG